MSAELVLDGEPVGDVVLEEQIRVAGIGILLATDRVIGTPILSMTLVRGIHRS